MFNIKLKNQTYNIAIWCPRHNIPFDGDIPIGIQRIKCNCINATNVCLLKKENRRRKMTGIK